MVAETDDRVARFCSILKVFDGLGLQQYAPHTPCAEDKRRLMYFDKKNAEAPRSKPDRRSSACGTQGDRQKRCHQSACAVADGKRLVDRPAASLRIARTTGVGADHCSLTLARTSQPVHRYDVAFARAGGFIVACVSAYVRSG